VTNQRTSVAFTDLLRSEWTKLRSLRSTAWTLLAMLVVGIGIAALIGAGAGEMYAEMTPEERRGFDPTAVPLNSIFLGQIVLGVLGILVITSEHATGVIQTSVAAMPRRGSLLAAKTFVFGAVALVAGQVMAFGAFFVSQALIAAQDAVPHARLTDPGVLPAVLGAGFYLFVIGLLSVALGTLIRATAGALATLVGITLVVPMFSSVLPEWTFELLRYWPSLGGLSVTKVLPDPDFPHPWLSFTGMCAGIAVVLGTAFAAFRRRDV
jgi:ABC-2 type transport system permease protein